MKKIVCALPFAGNQDIKIIRSPFHRKLSGMEHCIDFAMPIGTPILAVANGTIIARESRYSKSYNNPRKSHRANYIIIDHGNGFVSFYAHLQWRGILVPLNHKVIKGQVIAYSGQTGYATYPHLHFGLYDKSLDKSSAIHFPDLIDQKIYPLPTSIELV